MDFTILIDTREQTPLVFSGLTTARATLTTGDYSCVVDGEDLRDGVAIERKSLSDLLGCIGQSRARFERELSRLAQIRFRALVIEASLSEVAAGTRYSQLTARQVIGSVMAWVFKYGIAPIFAGDPDSAATVTATLLSHAARYSQIERRDHGNEPTAA
jgi:DNA excision repair protein ERCC-4